MDIDQDATEAASKRMTQAALRLSKMAPEVAQARQLKEFNSDRLKRAFSVLVAEKLNEGIGVGAAEHYARASNSYGAALNDLGAEYRLALSVLAEHESLIIQYEAARSILALEREKIRL